MVAAPFDFVTAIAHDRDLVVTSAGAHVCRVEPRATALAWFCDLDDGTPTGENDPASHVRWVCPALRAGTPAAAALEVRRSGPQSDLGRLMTRIGRLSGRAAKGPTGSDNGGPFVYTDPKGILDDDLRRRIESWPTARHGDGVVRPAELSSIKVTREGLVVESASWWDSAPALDHQIGLAVDIASRMTA
jgi:hypothetical protein